MKSPSNRLTRLILRDGLEFIKDQEQIHFLTKVLRLGLQSELVGVFKQTEYLLRIAYLAKEKIKLETIAELEPNSKELNIHLKLYLPILKGDKNELVIQKCTELGTKEFVFVDYEHSVKQLGSWQKKLERFSKITQEAVEQSERVIEPIINSQVISLSELKIADNETPIVFMERSFSKDSLNLLSNKKPSGFSREDSSNKVLSLFFGPEGGFSQKEKNFFANQVFLPVTLGKRILRAETAIIAGCSLVALLSEAEY
jgi:16S rRNA (uracil1498-N3)-methyltransferase